MTGLRAVRSGIQISAGEKYFSLLYIQTGPVAHPAIYSVCAGGACTLRVKQPRGYVGLSAFSCALFEGVEVYFHYMPLWPV